MRNTELFIVLLLTVGLGLFPRLAAAVENASDLGSDEPASTNFNKHIGDGELQKNFTTEVNAGVDTDYRVQPGDMLVISVWKEKDLP